MNPPVRCETNRFLHFAGMKKDHEGSIRKIADLIGARPTDDEWRAITDPGDPSTYGPWQPYLSGRARTSMVLRGWPAARLTFIRGVSASSLLVVPLPQKGKNLLAVVPTLALLQNSRALGEKEIPVPVEDKEVRVAWNFWEL